jgi:hypothetical protein
MCRRTTGVELLSTFGEVSTQCNHEADLFVVALSYLTGAVFHCFAEDRTLGGTDCQLFMSRILSMRVAEN